MNGNECHLYSFDEESVRGLLHHVNGLKSLVFIAKNSCLHRRQILQNENICPLRDMLCY